MKIITGATGTTHVTSNNDGELNQAIFGDGLVVLANGYKLEASIVTNNLITVKDGDLVFQGRHALIEPGTEEEITISTGAIDTNRNDLIIARYAIDIETGYESLTLEVLEGQETSGTAADPTVTEGDIRTGATLAEAALYRVRIEGINIVALEPMFEPLDGPVGQSGEFVRTGDQLEQVNNVPLNADMLGGHAASYYATNTDLSKLNYYPNWSNPSEIIAQNSSVTFTIQEDAWYLLKLHNGSTNTQNGHYVYINDLEILSHIGQPAYNHHQILLPLSKNDVVRYDASDSNVYFTMYKLPKK